ncbi:MAG: hypothetical protein HY843_02840 [Bdellovibrio sp.]|nr:hypothetical protein [Bdellovibrio sp.]
MKCISKYIILLVCLSCLNCGNPRQVYKPSSVAEAEDLIDKGENEKAILILEKYMQEEPKNKEVKILLASAYLGYAGLSIYSYFESFHDLLFERPLSETLFGDKSSQDLASVSINMPGLNDDLAPIEVMLLKLSQFFLIASNQLSFFNRFNTVMPAYWQFVDRALKLIDSTEKTNDIVLYKILIWIIYIKSYLKYNIVGDKSVGSRQWICNLDVERFYLDIKWILRSVLIIVKDVKIIKTEGSAALNDLEIGLSDIEHIMNEFSDQKNGVRLSLKGLEYQLKCTPEL